MTYLNYNINPVIHARPRIAGTIAANAPTRASPTIRPSNRDPMMLVWSYPMLLPPELTGLAAGWGFVPPAPVACPRVH